MIFTPEPSLTRGIKSRRLRWAGHVARVQQKRKAYRILVGRTDDESPLGTYRRRLQHNIKIDISEMGWKGVNWIHMD